MISENIKKRIQEDSEVFQIIWKAERDKLFTYLSNISVDDINFVISNLATLQDIPKISENVEVIFRVLYNLWSIIMKEKVEIQDILAEVQLKDTKVKDFLISVLSPKCPLLESIIVSKKLEEIEDIDKIQVNDTLINLWTDQFCHRLSLKIKTTSGNMETLNVSYPTLKNLVQFLEERNKESEKFINTSRDKWHNIVHEL